MQAEATSAHAMRKTDQMVSSITPTIWCMEEQDGILLAVAEAACRYRFPARYDDEIVIRTSIARSSTRLVEFRYELAHVESGRVLATGSTTHIFCDRDMRPCRLPDKYWHAFRVNGR